MLTIEMLRQNTVLAALPEDTLRIIATMSQNDENTVIGTKTGMIHGQYDADILSISGVAKNDGEKSYDYLKRVLGDYKGKISSVTETAKELVKAKATITELNAKIAAGSTDESLKQQLKDAKAQVTQLQSQLTSKEKELTDAKASYESGLKSAKVDFAFSQATAGIKFKDSVPESIRPILLASAKAEVLAKGTPDFVDDGKGGKKFVLRDKDGNILNNVKNSLNPYTLTELLNESSLKDVIDLGKVQPGGGTGPRVTGGNGGGSDLIDLSNVKNQIDADNAIEKYLLGKGLTRDSSEFAEQSLKLREDNNVSDLPIR